MNTVTWPTGSLGEQNEWELRFNRAVAGGDVNAPSDEDITPCPHAQNIHTELSWQPSPHTSPPYTRLAWTVPRTIAVQTQGGFDETEVCVDCALAAIESVRETVIK